jgi:hypothetical protein
MDPSVALINVAQGRHVSRLISLLKTLRLNLFNCLRIKSMFHCSNSIVYLEKIGQSYDFCKKGRSCRPIHKKLIDAKS